MPFDPDETIIDGLTAYVQLSNDKRDVDVGAMVYRTVAEAFRPNVSDEETCSLAFMSMIIRPDIRTECFVAVLESKVIVAWKKGAIRKTLQTEIIPRNRIKSANIKASSNTALMTIEADTDITLALPKGRKDLWDAIGQAVIVDTSGPAR